MPLEPYEDLHCALAQHQTLTQQLLSNMPSEMLHLRTDTLLTSISPLNSMTDLQVSPAEGNVSFER